ncbi:MAG: hypothetical protein LBG22_11200 [Treponema sp.]|jgi:hypothetical protein|nr:hypothetical protein [Treponema sp.]
MGFWDFVKEIGDASLKAGFSPDEVNKGVRPHPDRNTVQDPWGTHHYYGGSNNHRHHGITPKKK